jgi:hypothetical protein
LGLGNPLRLEDDGVAFLLPSMWLSFGLPSPFTVGGLPTSIPSGFLSSVHGGSFYGPRLSIDGTSSLTPVPEPGTLTLLTSGIGFAIVRWRQSRRRRNQETD